eukprot:COSAG03_NODE_25016_length_268_cov_0.727811_1_plen_41_part_01
MSDCEAHSRSFRRDAARVRDSLVKQSKTVAPMEESSDTFLN